MNKLELSKVMERLKKMREEIQKEAEGIREQEIAIRKEAQEKIDALVQPLKNKIEIMKAEQKKYFGICEGETIDIFSTLEMFMKVTESES